jgi:hypothetical protein
LAVANDWVANLFDHHNITDEQPQAPQNTNFVGVKVGQIENFLPGQNKGKREGEICVRRYMATTTKHRPFLDANDLASEDSVQLQRCGVVVKSRIS